MPRKSKKKAHAPETEYFLMCLLCKRGFAAAKVRRGRSSYELPPCPRCRQSSCVGIYGSSISDLKLRPTRNAEYKRMSA